MPELSMDHSSIGNVGRRSKSICFMHLRMEAERLPLVDKGTKEAWERFHMGEMRRLSSWNFRSRISDEVDARVCSLMCTGNSVKWCTIWFCRRVMRPVILVWVIMFVWVDEAIFIAFLAVFVIGENNCCDLIIGMSVVESRHSKHGIRTLLLI